MNKPPEDLPDVEAEIGKYVEIATAELPVLKERLLRESLPIDMGGPMGGSLRLVHGANRGITKLLGTGPGDGMTIPYDTKEAVSEGVLCAVFGQRRVVTREDVVNNRFIASFGFGSTDGHRWLQPYFSLGRLETKRTLIDFILANHAGFPRELFDQIVTRIGMVPEDSLHYWLLSQQAILFGAVDSFRLVTLKPDADFHLVDL